MVNYSIGRIRHIGRFGLTRENLISSEAGKEIDIFGDPTNVEVRVAIVLSRIIISVVNRSDIPMICHSIGCWGG